MGKVNAFRNCDTPGRFRKRHPLVVCKEWENKLQIINYIRVSVKKRSLTKLP